MKIEIVVYYCTLKVAYPWNHYHSSLKRTKKKKLQQHTQLWRHGERKLLEFLEALNVFRSNIKFTVEYWRIITNCWFFWTWWLDEYTKKKKKCQRMFSDIPSACDERFSSLSPVKSIQSWESPVWWIQKVKIAAMTRNWL